MDCANQFGSEKLSDAIRALSVSALFLLYDLFSQIIVILKVCCVKLELIYGYYIDKSFTCWL